MDRYAVISVDLATGDPRRVGLYEGEDGADSAAAHADRVNGRNAGTRAFFVGLRVTSGAQGTPSR